MAAEDRDTHDADASRQVTRREFLHTAGAAAGAAALAGTPGAAAAWQGQGRPRLRMALVGTGVRGSGMYGRQLVQQYRDSVEFVGLCDVNPGRLRYAAGYIGAGCPTFTDLGEMLDRTKPATLVVTSWDWEHHNHIVAAMQRGIDVICEKPVTIDEQKAQAILDAQRRAGRSVVVTHNYRYPPHRAKLKEVLLAGRIGDISSVDFHWNITHDHLQQYMRRWHGHRDRGGTLWVHKSSHHFDMVNWYLGSEPVEVFAYADLERYGAKGPFRSDRCRGCPHQARCPAYWDIGQSEHLVKLYVENEHHDGYIRDNCVFRESIDIYDKHAAIVRYANGAYLNYSLTADTDQEGFWIAFNGTKGRIEGREINWPRDKYHHDWILYPRGGEPEVIRTTFREGGQPTSDHWGGDPLLLDKLFKDPAAPDPLHQAATLRDGVMAVLAGVAARKSVESGRPVKVAGLTDLEPRAATRGTESNSN